eukprot:scaffold109_cov252-Pinguiococcus_pyrenoidosus.AAC.54
MQRYMASFGNAQDQQMGGMDQAKLEINPKHPIIVALNKKVANNESDAVENAKLIYDLAAMTGGYSIADPAQFAKSVQKLLQDRIADEDAQASGGAAEVEVVE